MTNDPVMALVNSRPGFAAMTPASDTCATRINEFIYQSNGTSNAYMLVTDAGRLIINTGLDFEALTHKALFDAVCPGPTAWLILTQGHVDHCGGINHFREPETRVLAQANHPECRRDDQRIQAVRTGQASIWFDTIFARAQAVAAEHPEAFSKPPGEPDVLFEQHYTITHGGLQLELIATPGGETTDSCVTWLPQHRILFSGNLFGPLFPHFPNINTLRGDKYRFLEPYLESLRRVRALEPELLITGHFSPIEGWPLIRACLDRLEQAVVYIHEKTLEGINAGIDIWRLMDQIKLPAELAVGQGYGKVSWAVRTLWESYMGWFKAQHSSELYATQPLAAYRELVELAGVDAVIERARQTLAEQQIETALLLTEAVLALDERATEAIALNLAIHQQLLAQVKDDNFWESGWLRQVIARRQAQLDF